MKCLFLLSACVLLSFNGAYAQTQIFNETFETNSATVGSWTMVDRDGDGANWFFIDNYEDGFSSKLAASISRQNVTPDNLLISPLIALAVGKQYKLSFLVGAWLPDYYAEHYAVYILSGNTAFTGTETPVLEETLSQVNAVTKTIDISAYAGQNVRIYFRHYNCTRQYVIKLDNVIVTESATSGISSSSESAEVSLSPSPVGSQLQVSLSGGGDLQKVEVLDLNGRVARSVAASGASASVDVSGLSAGVYVARVVSGDGTVVRKFVKK